MGGDSSKVKELEDRNASLSCDVEKLREKLKESEEAVKKISEDHEVTLRQLNEIHANWDKEKENLKEREAEVERLRRSGLEREQIVAMTNQIAKDRQWLMDKEKQSNRELEAALRQQEQLLKKISEDSAKDKKQMIEAQNDLKENLAEMIRYQKTLPAEESVRKLINIAKSTWKSVKQHAMNPSKLMKETEINQRDLDRQITEVKSYMEEGFVTTEALTAFADAAVLNTHMLEFLEEHKMVDFYAVEVAREAHQEEWQELMSARKKFYPLTDQKMPEIENIFYDRFSNVNRPLNRGLACSASFAAASNCSADMLQSSSETGLAAKLESLTVEEVSSTTSTSGGGEGCSDQEGRGSQSLQQELYQRAAALTSALEEGLQSGYFDKEGDATEDQDTTAAFEDFQVL